MFKSLLNQARDNFVAHQREEEIRHLDLDPEEYVMLRDDKSPMAIELLKAILEKLNIPHWEVDEKTSRVARILESSGARKDWALSITSDTRRFHLKVYRDFERELEDLDLVSSRGLCAAITFVEQTIHDIRERRIREAEIRRLAAIEEEKRRQQQELKNITAKIDEINIVCRRLYSKKQNALRLGDEFLKKCREYVAQKIIQTSQSQFSLPIEDIAAVKPNFEGRQFKIIDDVPCKLDEINSAIHVSNKFLIDCLEEKNLISPICFSASYEPETRSLVLNIIERSSGEIHEVDQKNELTPRRFDNLKDPLREADILLTQFVEIDSKMRDDVAKISLFSIYSETSTFEDLKKSIDLKFAVVDENVHLLMWNAKNSK